MAEDDTKTNTETETPLVIETSTDERTAMGLPLSVFVRGGTHSSSHDAMMAEHKANAAERRAAADKEQALARVPISDGGAAQFTHKFTSNPETERAQILLQYLGPGGREVYYECLADVVMLENELSLILVCPKCLKNGDPMDLCQLQIRQSNKQWELDLRKAGELVIFDGQPYRSAGRVRECPKFRCGNCGWTARIDDNKVYTE